MPERTGRLSTGECLDPEVLSAYIDGTLEVRERAEVEAHLASCADCYDVMSEVLRIREELSAARPMMDATPELSSTPPPWAAPERREAPAPVSRPSSERVVRGSFGRRKAVLGVAGGLLAAAAALLLVVRLQPTWWTGGVDPKLADLVEAVGEERTVEARLTGGFKYGPLRSPVRSGGRVGPTDNWSLLAAAGRIREEADKNPTPENLHASGVAHLLLYEYDLAVGAFEEATRQAPTIARFQSDLSAAYLARAGALNRADDWSKGLAAAERAVAIEPTLREAVFNRALSLESLGLAEQARAAWQHYLTLDSTSPWSSIAKQRLESQESAPGASVSNNTWSQALAAWPSSRNRVKENVNLDPQLAREWTESVLLAAWAQSVLKGAQSTYEEELATEIGALLSLRGDHMLASHMQLLLRASSSGIELRRFADAHLAFAEAWQLFNSDRIAESEKPFEFARASFSELKSPMALAAEIGVGTAAYFRGDVDGAVRIASRVEARNAGRHAAVQARALWVLGLIDTARGDFQSGLQRYLASIRLYSQLGEAENTTFLQVALAETYDFLGQQQQAWAYRVAALRQRASIRSPRRQHTILVNTALNLARNERPEAALAFQNAAVGVANGLASMAVKAEAHLHRARLQMAMGHRDESLRDLRIAEELAKGLGDVRDRIDAEILITKASDPLGDHRVAVFSLGEAVKTLRRRELLAKLPALLQAKARLERASNDLVSAEASLRAALDAATAHVVDLRGPQRISYTDEIWTIYHDTAALALAQGHLADAVNVLDTAKIRLWTTSSEEIAAPGETTRPGRRLVQFATIENTVYAFVFESKGIAVKRLGDLPAIESLVRRLRRAVEQRSPTVLSILATLFEVLVRPWYAGVAPKDELVLIPDGILHQVPFTALRDDRYRRYLGQSHAVLIAPLLPRWRSQVTNSRRPASVIAIGNNASRVQDLGLPALSRAEMEAVSVGAVYASSVVQVGSEATPSAFIDLAGTSDVIHIAAHAVANHRYPEMGWLSLSPDAQHASGLLLANDLSSARLENTNLVFLNGCDTAQGSLTYSEGPLSIARAFLKAGTQAVVATLWPTDDRGAERFATIFHRYYVENGDAALALTTTISTLTAMGDELSGPEAWGAYQLYIHPFSRSSGP